MSHAPLYMCSAMHGCPRGISNSPDQIRPTHGKSDACADLVGIIASFFPGSVAQCISPFSSTPLFLLRGFCHEKPGTPNHGGNKGGEQNPELRLDHQGLVLESQLVDKK